MGKKKNKKKNRIYTKKQFINIICTHCDICHPASFNPTFCYEEVYKNNPDIFMEHCYIHLLRFKMKSEIKGFSFTIINQFDFREIFCDSGVCGGKTGVYCERILECLRRFSDQMFGTGSAKKENNKKTKRFVCDAYPTFFTSDNEEWKNEIKGILEDGN